MPISNLYRRQSAYFFDGDEGESIFLFFLYFFLFIFYFLFFVNSRNEYQEAQITDPDPDDGGMESYLQGGDSKITFMWLK